MAATASTCPRGCASTLSRPHCKAREKDCCISWSCDHRRRHSQSHNCGLCWSLRSTERISRLRPQLRSQNPARHHDKEPGGRVHSQQLRCTSYESLTWWSVAARTTWAVRKSTGWFRGRRRPKKHLAHHFPDLSTPFAPRMRTTPPSNLHVPWPSCDPTTT